MIRVTLTDDRHDVRQNFEHILSYFDDIKLLWSVNDGEILLLNVFKRNVHCPM
ncbi:MAG: hypothetical protein R2784_18890 [Saprospiraceae bacterium]